MKNFNRDDLGLSLCGLNCGLCPMHLDGYCPGCGGGEGNQSCRIARCSQEHARVLYCNQCEEYPCEKYERFDEYDSFITHRNRKRNLERVTEIGTEAYHAKQEEKREILKFLLSHYNDGRKKSFYCIAVNLLELKDLRSLIMQITEETMSEILTQKEKSAYAASLFQAIADQKGIVLKLHKKPSKKK